MKSCRTNIEIFYILQQDVRTYAGDLIYCIGLRLDLGDRKAVTFSCYFARFFWKKPKELILRWMATFEKVI